jgi:N-methylhydantoinase B
MHDVQQGYVSEDAARMSYGVVIHDGKVDAAATQKLRQQMKAA